MITNKSVDMSNLRFGRLVVLEKVGGRRVGKTRKKVKSFNSWTMWLCQCDCGKTSVVAGQRLRRGETKSCGCLRRVSRLKIPTEDLVRNREFDCYRKSASDRGLTFSLTKEDLFALIQKNCEYCGDAPSRTRIAHGRTFLFNGLDRKDSGRGYEKDNVVPACSFCNYGKRQRSESEFREWISRLIKFNQGKISEQRLQQRADNFGLRYEFGLRKQFAA